MEASFVLAAFLKKAARVVAETSLSCGEFRSLINCVF